MIKKNAVFLIGLLLCLPSVWYFIQGRFFHLHDFTHVTRLIELERGLLDGQLPVRWSQNLGYGYGLPQFSFYGPLFYYEALIFRLFGITALWSVKLTVVLQTVFSFTALFFIGKKMWGEWGGLVSGIACIYAPYRAVDMYVRGSLGELSGITFIALSLWAGLAFTTTPSRKRLVLLAAAIAGIPLSHNLMALVAIPFIAVFILFFSWLYKTFTLKMLLSLVSCAVLAVGLSAFYSIPALLEKNFTQADILTGGFSNYNHHFLYIRQFFHSKWAYGGSISGPDDDISFELGKVQLLAWIMSGLVSLAVIWKRKTMVPVLPILFISCLTAISLFIMLYKAKFIWDSISLMAYIQFPWRYLSIAMVLVALLTGSLLSFIQKTQQQMILAVILTVALIGSQISHFRPERFLENATESIYFTDPIRIQTEMSRIIPDFLPKTAMPEKLPKPITATNRFTLSGSPKVSIEVNKSHYFALSIQNDQSTELTAAIFDFPGWTLYMNGVRLPHSRTPEGLITAVIPGSSGDSRVEGRFEDTPVRRLANRLSLAALAACTILLLPFTRNGKLPHGS